MQSLHNETDVDTSDTMYSMYGPDGTHACTQVFIRLRGRRKPHLTNCWTLHLLTTSQHHSSTQILPCNHTNIRIHAHTTPHVSYMDLYANDGARIRLIFWIYITGHLNIHLRASSCDEVGNQTSQPPTTSQHHVLAWICRRNYMNVRAHTL